jgi:hypothetical protein
VKLTFSDTKNNARAQTRNQLMTDLADQITIGYASPGGQLEDLLKEIEKPINKIV